MSFTIKIVIVIFSPFVVAWLLRRHGTVIWGWTDRRWGAVTALAAVGTAVVLASDSGTALLGALAADWFLWSLWMTTWPPDPDGGD
jgi:hypothetical protein